MAFSYFGFVTCIFQWCFSRLNLGAYTTLKAYNKLPKSWAEEIAEFGELKPDQIDDYLKINSKLNIAL